eukprot:Hpha_TRINITY_DN31148_c0_g1::TRINITY_DN31148_c0_g1_i1::g.33116::m.33116
MALRPHGEGEERQSLLGQSEGLRRELRALRDVAVGLTMTSSTGSSNTQPRVGLNIDGDKKEDRDPLSDRAAELHRRAAVLEENDKKDTLLGVFSSFERLLVRVTEAAAVCDESARRAQAELRDFKAAAEQRAAAQALAERGAAEEAGKLKARLEEVESRSREQDRIIADLRASSERVVDDFEDTISRRLTPLEGKVHGIEAQIPETVRRVAELESVDAPRRLTELDSRVSSVEEFTRKFSEFSQRAVNGLENSADSRFAAQEERHQQLLQYHTQLTQHLAKIQDSLDHRTRLLQTSLESEASRLAEDTQNAANQWRAALEGTQGEVRVLERSVLAALRRLRDNQLATPLVNAVTSLPPPPPSSGSTIGIPQAPRSHHPPQHADVGGPAGRTSQPLGLSDLQPFSPGGRSSPFSRRRAEGTSGMGGRVGANFEQFLRELEGSAYQPG